MEQKYIKDFTEDELLEALANKLYGQDYFIDKKEEKDVFEKASGIDGLMEYLRSTMEADIHRYFSAITEKERDQARGAYARTAYFKSLLVSKKDKQVLVNKLKTKRHL